MHCPTQRNLCSNGAPPAWISRFNRSASKARKATLRAKAIADAHAEAQAASAAATGAASGEPSATTNPLQQSATARIKGVPVLQPADEMCNAAKKVLRHIAPRKDLNGNTARAANVVRLVAILTVRL